MSSLSRTTMINRVKEFLPGIKPSLFVTRGTAGIRSLLVDSDGNFMPDMVEIRNEKSLHILNYNSPGVYGCLTHFRYDCKPITSRRWTTTKELF